MNKPLWFALLIAIVVGGLVLAGTLHLDVQASTNVIGIISSDTTWTKANSPYNLTGNVLVNNGVNLTIEAGVTVLFNVYFMDVNGTLSAKGTETEKIIMSGSGIANSGDWKGRIVFSNTSANSIIEYAQITSTPEVIIGIYTSSVTLNHTTISGSSSDAIYIYGDSSPLITGNHISNSGNCIRIFGGSSAIITDNVLSNSGCGISIVQGKSPNITGNIISNNSKGIYIWWDVDSVHISNNIISNNALGIDLDFVVGYTGSSISFTITGNLIINNYGDVLDGGAIRIGYEHPGNVSNNTICLNTNGLLVNGIQSLTATQNNIYGNINYNVRLDSSSDINATYNWWGTTDAQAINQSIYDFNDDFLLGRVNFVPFLTEMNPGAPAIPTFTILASAGAGGSINPSGNVSVSYGSNQTFTVLPNPSYQIVSVLMDEVPSTAPYTFSNVVSNHAITATFEPIPTPTPTPSPSPSPSPTPTPSPTATPTPTSTPTLSPSPSTSPSPAPTATPSPSPTATASPTPTPSIPEFPSFIVLPLLMATIVVGAFFYRKKFNPSSF